MFRDAPPPVACTRIRAALEVRGRGPVLAAKLERLLRTLATSKPGGTFLCLGEGAGEAAAWILDGMDLSSGLVALVRESDEEVALKRELERDLRVSVHRQDARAFLLDVSAHRFDLIADLTPGERPAIVRLGLNLLRPGGFYVASRAGNTLHAVFRARRLGIRPIGAAPRSRSVRCCTPGRRRCRAHRPSPGAQPAQAPCAIGVRPISRPCRCARNRRAQRICAPETRGPRFRLQYHPPDERGLTHDAIAVHVRIRVG
jgi:hypothetical protein